ncbi:MAG: FAD-binding oxidoreductase [Candidatus Wildermuthbacteria bacterium]|nr:FAD-binding oxidoreductase [Candidatus Wildermuthbacteria bacterium]
MRDNMIRVDEEARKEHSRDASLFEILPKAVAFPRNAKEVCDLVNHAREQARDGVSLTCWSGGTDMAGGPLGESVVVDMTGLNAIVEVGNDSAVVQPGVFYRDFEKETLKKGIFLPSYPASREICTVGGMVANNAGGEKNLAYGKTERHVRALEVVLADGKTHRLKKLSADELAVTMREEGFEGDVYRKTYRLLEDNFNLIKSRRPNVSKNSAGYALWNVWDRKHFDLAQLFVGSQGTLGIITEITVALVRPKTHSAMVVLFLNDLKRLPGVIEAVLKEGPESFESYDDHTLKLALRFFPDFAKVLGARGIVSLGVRFLPEFWMMITKGAPKLVLLAEFTGGSSEEAVGKAERALGEAKALGIGGRLEATKAGREKYFAIRRESFNILRHHLKNLRTAPFIDDIIVRPELLAEFLPKLEAILACYPKLVYTIAGHAGDGNFHIIPLVDPKDPSLPKTIEELSRAVYGLVLEYGGSITAEHNDGLIRTPFLEQMYGSEMVGLFREIKRIFDPNGIFNPNKKVDGTLSYALSHLRKD